MPMTIQKHPIILHSVIAGIILLLGVYMIRASSQDAEAKVDTPRLAVLVEQMAGLQKELEIMQQEKQQLLKRIGVLEEQHNVWHQTLACLSPQSNALNVYFSGCNVHVQNGEGATASINGRGNLIVGYNESILNDTSNREGSHNLVIGPEHSYSRYGGFVAGIRNAVRGPYASVGGGLGNVAKGEAASVNGGQFNMADGDKASVNGGRFNTASGRISSVGGGQGNTASGEAASVSGGESNTADGVAAAVSGGQRNHASGGRASISAGNDNMAGGDYASIIGGLANTADETLSIVPLK